MANIGDVSKIALPNGDTANMKDSSARSSIEDLFESVVHVGIDVYQDQQTTNVEGYPSDSYYINSISGAVFKLKWYTVIGGQSGYKWDLQFNLDKKWHFGTDITGTGSGSISSTYKAYKGDMYLNTDTMNLYLCTGDVFDEFSDITTSYWSYKCTLGGSAGSAAQWFAGSAITGTGTQTATISGANVGDMYLNTQSSSYTSCGYVYKCTAANTWVYQGVIKGPQGTQGNPGSTGYTAKFRFGTEVTGTSTDPTYQYTEDANTYDMYINTSTMNYYSSNTGRNYWKYEGNLTALASSYNTDMDNRIQLPEAFTRENSADPSTSECWTKLASASTVATANDIWGFFLVHNNYISLSTYNTEYGVLRVRLRNNTSSAGLYAASKFDYIGNLCEDNFKLLVFENTNEDGKAVTGTITVEIWHKANEQYSSLSLVLLHESRRQSKGRKWWTLYDTADVGANALPTASRTISLTPSNINNTSARATKLPATQVGSTTKPVYISSDGVPTELSYSLEKSVSSNAVLTDQNIQCSLLSSTNTSEYPLMLAPTGTTATGIMESKFSTQAKYKPSTNTLSVNVSGNASYATSAGSATSATSATTATNANNLYVVKSTASDTIDNLPFFIGQSSAIDTGNKPAYMCSGLCTTIRQGTTSADGVVCIIAGNSTPTGTAGNRSGIYRMYGNSSKWIQIRPITTVKSPSANVTIEVPYIAGAMAIQQRYNRPCISSSTYSNNNISITLGVNTSTIYKIFDIEWTIDGTAHCMTRHCVTGSEYSYARIYYKGSDTNSWYTVVVKITSATSSPNLTATVYDNAGTKVNCSSSSAVQIANVYASQTDVLYT